MTDNHTPADMEDVYDKAEKAISGVNFGDLLPDLQAANKTVRKTASPRDSTTLTLKLIEAELYGCVFQTLMRTVREIRLDLKESEGTGGEVGLQVADEHRQAVAA